MTPQAVAKHIHDPIIVSKWHSSIAKKDMPFLSAWLLNHQPRMVLLSCTGLGDRREGAKSF